MAICLARKAVIGTVDSVKYPYDRLHLCEYGLLSTI